MDSPASGILFKGYLEPKFGPQLEIIQSKTKMKLLKCLYKMKGQQRMDVHSLILL